MKIGIIRERKNPPDKRVVFSPNECASLLKKYPKLEILVESSPIRVFKDKEYVDAGLTVTNDVTSCDVLLGVKEVPIESLIANKKYFFFSHTIKKQPYNRKLLKAILDKNIEMYDHEVITNQKGSRVVAFGRYAGIVGAYNGFRTLGLKYKIFNLPKAETLKNQAHLIEHLKSVKSKIPALKIILTGSGRVSGGAKEMLEGMGLKEISVNEFLENPCNEPVFVQIDALDYNKRKDGSLKDKYDFFNHPEEYESNFMRFAKVADMLITGHFFSDGSPYLFTREDAKKADFKIRVVADISCDIDGPIACTIQPSTINDPIYGYDAQTESITDFKLEKAIAVMAVDNLPCELPNDASVGFGKMFAKYVIPAFFNYDESGVLERARMTRNKNLTEKFNYLQDYVDIE